MDIHALAAKLSDVSEPGGTVLTLTLDVSKSGVLPAAARVFLKDSVADYLSSEVHPPAVRNVLRKLGRKVRDFVERGLRPGTNGLFLVAGGTVWETVELLVPMPNFVTLGRRPYLAPLLAAAARSPRAYLVQVDPQGVRVDELHLGARVQVASLEGPDLAVAQERTQNARSTGRGVAPWAAGPGRGGSERDRQQRRETDAVEALLRDAARTVGERHAASPSEAVFFFGHRALFPAFRDHVPAALRAKTTYLGPKVENGRDLATAAFKEVERVAARRLDEEIREFRERREQGRLMALGPQDVIEQIFGGDVARVYVDPADPVPGVACSSCGARYPGLRERCPGCSEDVAATSIVQEVVSHALRHPPLAITFVAPGTKWLRDLGGMAALLSAKRLRRKA